MKPSFHTRQLQTGCLPVKPAYWGFKKTNNLFSPFFTDDLEDEHNTSKQFLL